MNNTKKAEKLGDMLKTFRTEPLDDETFSKFYYDKTMAIRTGDENVSPLEDLFEECTTPLLRNAHLLMGHRGCGKSTELYRLKQRLEKAGQPVCLIDFTTEADHSNASNWDLMLMITEGLCKIANDMCIDVPATVLTSVINYLVTDKIITTDTNILTEIGIEGGVEAKTPAILSGILNLFVKIKGGLKANTADRIVLTKKMEKRASEWITYINEITDWVTIGLSGKQPILIFENIDKCQPPDRAFDILRYPYLAEMPFPIIYTFPISLFYDQKFSYIRSYYNHHMLPMIKVSNVDKNYNDDGIDVIKEIVKLRIDKKLIDDRALTILIKKTGGVLRDLFECIISAARRASRRGSQIIGIEDAKRALNDLGSEMSRQISMPDNDKLANIYNNIEYREQIEDLDFLLKKMQALVVLEYKNGERWHDLHPMIAEFLNDQGIINIANDYIKDDITSDVTNN